jgi:hypothetical protein
VLFDTGGWRVPGGVRTYYDVSLDDQRFLMVRSVAGEQDSDQDIEVILVENFFEELKEKVVR